MHIQCQPYTRSLVKETTAHQLRCHHTNKLKFLVDMLRELTRQLSEAEHDEAKLKILVDEAMQSYTP